MLPKTITTFILALAIACAAPYAIAGQKDQYRPYENGFPQIIQESDYQTIAAVEALASELKKLPKGALSCSLNGESIHFSAEGKGNVTINSPSYGLVVIGDRHYSSKSTIIFFTTLRKLLTDYGRAIPCVAKYDQFSTRAYKQRTIIEFDFGPQVVVVDAFSNGPKNEERLYILDLVDRQDSYFWGRL